MANQNGGKYGFTALFPIKPGEHAARLRTHLRALDAHPFGSPLSEVPIIHMARFAIIDHLPYQGVPAKRDALRSAYLLFLCEFDGKSPDVLARHLKECIPAEATAIWEHCLAFPGTQSVDRLSAYFAQCQLETTLFLADRPDDCLEAILKALRYKRRFAQLLLLFQQHAPPNPADLKRRLRAMVDAIERSPPPHAGAL